MCLLRIFPEITLAMLEGASKQMSLSAGAIAAFCSLYSFSASFHKETESAHTHSDYVQLPIGTDLCFNTLRVLDSTSTNTGV